MRDAALAWPVSLTAILIWFVAVASPRSKGKDQTIARTLASKPRASEEITLAQREMPPSKKLRHSPYFTVEPVRGERRRVQHRCGSPVRADTVPGRPRLQSGTGFSDPKED